MKRTPLFWSLSALFAVGALTSGCEKNTPELDPDPAPVELVVLSEDGTDKGSFDNTGGDVTLTVGSNYSWKASVTGGVDWVELDLREEEREGGKYKESRVTVVVAPSYDEAERTATITFTAKEKTAAFTVTQGATFLSVEATTADIYFAGETINLDISTNALDWGAEVVSGGDWCSVAKNGSGSISITGMANSVDSERTADLRIIAGEITREVTVTQGGYQISWEDREVVRIQKATEGNGIELILMGEGYTYRDMAKETGKYERDMRAAADHFFSIYPYNEYRDYFNVWIVGAVSKESGMSVAGGQTKDTVFKLQWDGEGTTNIASMEHSDTKEITVHRYARLVSDGEVHKNINNMTVIIPINYDIYAGTCIMSFDGFSYAMCPANTKTEAGMTFKALVVHEAGGHGFAKLEDEYIYHKNATMPSEERDEIKRWKDRAGHFANIDVNVGGNVTKTSWAEIAANLEYSVVGSRYSRVDIYEGACKYGKGIWRPEHNSCMNNNVLYFNAPSRWAMVRRIMALSGKDPDYTAAEFMEDDVIPQYPTEGGMDMGTRSTEPFIPLGRPILMD
jgi:hypothetical protein